MFEESKGLKICKTIHKSFFFVVWGFLLIDEKIYLVSHFHVIKMAVKFVRFFSTNNFMYIFFLNLRDSYFFQRLNVA